MGPDGIPEQRRIGAPLDAVPPGILPIGPSDGEVFETLDSVVNDGAVAHGRANHPAPAVRQGVDHLLQNIALDDELGAALLRLILLRRSLRFTE